MRKRVEQLRKVIALAHDPRMIAMLQEVIESAEADIKRLEARDKLTHEIPPTNQH